MRRKLHIHGLPTDVFLRVNINLLSTVHGLKQLLDLAFYWIAFESFLIAILLTSVVSAAHGDGMIYPGYYLITLNEENMAGNSNFGYKESTTFAVRDKQTSPVGAHTWIDIIKEDFDKGFGKFNDGGYNTKYYTFIKEWLGVICIQDGHYIDSSIYSDRIPFDKPYAKFKVLFAFYSNSMELYDHFCLDYCVNNGLDWSQEKCWYTYNDFENGLWYDDTTIEFAAVSALDSLRTQFRCSLNDDVLFDKIKVLGWA